MSLGDLPSEGIVVSDRKRTVFITLTGSVLAKLAGFHLSGNTGSEGVWISHGRQHYRLHPDRGILRPVSRRWARAHMYEEVAPDLPPPPGSRYRGRVAGRWRYAHPASGSGVRLAQWSGECEVPIAYWIAKDGTPTIVTGGTDLSLAPESLALGWTSDGRAVVLRGPGFCSNGTSPPGVYLYTAPGSGQLLYRTKMLSAVKMWSG